MYYYKKSQLSLVENYVAHQFEATQPISSNQLKPNLLKNSHDDLGLPVGRSGKKSRVWFLLTRAIDADGDTPPPSPPRTSVLGHFLIRDQGLVWGFLSGN
jgi:hypothetical protein